MKRSDLNVGDVLYFDSSSKWESDSYRARKVTILDVEANWRKPDSYGYRSYTKKMETDFTMELATSYSGGVQGVLVEMVDHRSANSEPYITVVQASHLRGEFETTLATVKGYAADRQAAYSSQVDKQKQNNELGEKLLADLKAHGIEGWHRYGDDSIDIRLADVQAILALLDADAR